MKIYKNICKCIGILLLLASLVNIVYADPTYINTLPYTINQSGEYVLNTSCTDLGSTAITINTSNVVLNGNKNVLDGAKAYNTYGIYIGNHKNITIKNLTVKEFYYGIDIRYSYNNSIMNANVFNNSRGIYLDYSYNNTITNTTVCDNEDGIYLYSYSSNNIITNTTVCDNVDGIYLYYHSSNNTITNTTVCDNVDGIYLGSSSNNTITNANICNNSYAGIYLNYYSSNNTITNAIVCDNGYGIYLDYHSSNNNILNNTFKNCGLFIKDGSSNNNNNIENNTVNGKPLIYLENKQNIILNNSNIGQVIAINCKNISVKNVELNNASVGIEYYGVNDSIITNATVCDNTYGIYMHSSSYNNISNVNSSNNSDTGIYLYSYSSNNIITNAIVCDNTYGIYMHSSSYNNISNVNSSNNGDTGINLDSSSNNTITNTTVCNNKDDGIYLDDSSSNNIIVNTTVCDNVDGIYLNYHSSNNTITNTTVYDNRYDGIYLYIYSSNNIITNTTVCDNVDGIYLYYHSSNNTITNTTVCDNGYGIYLDYSYNNTITNAIVCNNNYGIYLHYSSNNIYLNNLINNTENIGIGSSSYNSIFHSPEKISYKYNGKNYINYLGNYYSNYNGTDSNGDGIGDTPYVIDSNNNDTYPLIKEYYVYVDTTAPTVSINTPENKSYLIGTVQQINTTVIDNYKVDSVIAEIHYANGTITNITLSNVNGTNDYVNTTTLNFSTLGSYLIKIYANDTSGNLNNTENVSFKVIDNESPTVEINSPTNTSYLLENVSKINATVKDNYKVDTVIAEIHYSNGTVENITLTNVNGTNDYVNTSEIIYPIGTNTIVIYANDTSGNLNNSENISFTVIDNITPTVNITSPVENKSYLIGTVPQINTTVKDNYKVDTVIAEIHYSNGTVENITLTNVNGTNDYVNTSEVKYSVGPNTIVIYANDTSGNLNNTENVSFKIYKNPVVYHHSDNHHNSYSFPEVSSNIKVYKMRECIHTSNVVAGSSVDDNYAKELKDSVEYANSSENITQDVILIGGSVANPLTNKYMNKFPVNITNKYPGKNIGVIQKTTMMVKKENNIYANISLILLAGSDRYGTKAAVEYFKTLDDIPDEPVYVQWKDGKVVKIDKINH